MSFPKPMATPRRALLPPTLGLALAILLAGSQAAPAQEPAPETAPPDAASAPQGEAVPALPPAPAVVAVGTQAGYGERVVLGLGTHLAMAAGTPADAMPTLDGQQVGAAAWQGSWSPGQHEAGARVPSSVGDPADLPPLKFVYDPLPPVLQWEVGKVTLLDGHGLDQNVERHRPPRHTLPERDRRVPLLWSPDGRRWLPILPRKAEPDAAGLLADWEIASDRPQVFVWALADGAFGSGAPVAPAKLELVRLWAADDLSAVRDLRLRVRPLGRDYELEMVVTDLVGNATTVTWPLVRR
jgi:hypothetical protein